MAGDYLPRTDAALAAWTQNFVDVVNANLAAYGVTALEVQPIENSLTIFEGALQSQLAAIADAQSKTQLKDDQRAILEGQIRPLVRKIQAHPTVGDPMRAAAGITVPDTDPTPVGPPTTAPKGTVDTSQRLRHTIHFTDVTTPNSKAKPAGVRGVEIWVKIGEPLPTDPSELSFITLDSRTPHVIDFDGEDGGKMATYWLRWVSTRGEPGPWGQFVCATITA